MGIAKWLGFGDGHSLPYDCHVEYETGTMGHIPVFAKDGREALETIAKLMPAHEVIVRMTVVLRRPQRDVKA